jgi:hypothetical protein
VKSGDHEDVFGCLNTSHGAHTSTNNGLTDNAQGDDVGMFCPPRSSRLVRGFGSREYRVELPVRLARGKAKNRQTIPRRLCQSPRPQS